MAKKSTDAAQEVSENVPFSEFVSAVRQFVSEGTAQELPEDTKYDRDLSKLSGPGFENLSDVEWAAMVLRQVLRMLQKSEQTDPNPKVTKAIRSLGLIVTDLYQSKRTSSL